MARDPRSTKAAGAACAASSFFRPQKRGRLRSPTLLPIVPSLARPISVESFRREGGRTGWLGFWWRWRAGWLSNAVSKPITVEYALGSGGWADDWAGAVVVAYFSRRFPRPRRRRLRRRLQERTRF